MRNNMPNPMQMMGMLQNPQQAISNMFQQNLQSNPLFQRAQQMAEGKSENELKQIAQNLCQQRGIDINQALQQFQSQFGVRR